ncbi:MAG: hypothetical protein IJ761_00680 [Bacteroidales bacterium]|nr:hypothetical protein [Bacteroidales bacterium]
MKPLIIKRFFVALSTTICLLCSCWSAQGQSGLYIPSAKPIRNLQKALEEPEVFSLLIKYHGADSNYAIDDLDLLDSAYRIAFNHDNQYYYELTIEGYGDADTLLTQTRVLNIHRYLAMRGGENRILRTKRNRIYSSCFGDTTELIRYEVPTHLAVYDCNILPDSRKHLNKNIDLSNSVLLTFRNNQAECVGEISGCAIPTVDSIVKNKYVSLHIKRGAIYSVNDTKDTCPNRFTLKIEENLDYKPIIERYSLIPHKKQVLVQAGFVVLSAKYLYPLDSCRVVQRDSIFLRMVATQEQVNAKLKFFTKINTSRGMEYKALATKKVVDGGTTYLQATINAGQFDTIYIGKRIQEDELKSYFYEVGSNIEAASFLYGKKYYVPYRMGKDGSYELKKKFKEMFRIVDTSNVERTSKTKKQKTDPEEIID